MKAHDYIIRYECAGLGYCVYDFVQPRLIQYDSRTY